MCSFHFGWKDLFISFNLISSNVSFRVSDFSLIFLLDDLSFDVIRLWSFLLLLYYYFSKSGNICFIYLGVPMLGTYIFTNLISFCWADCFLIMQLLCLLLQSLKLVLSNISIALFQFLFAWSIFFHLFTFSLCVFLCLVWVSCRQQREFVFVSLFSHSPLCILLEHLIDLHVK